MNVVQWTGCIYLINVAIISVGFASEYKAGYKVFQDIVIEFKKKKATTLPGFLMYWFLDLNSAENPVT